MTSELSPQRNDAITYFTCSSISRHWEPFIQNRSGLLFPPIAALMFVKFKQNLWEFYRDSWSLSLSKICKSIIETFWDEVFMVRNTVKNGQPWSKCLAVISRKRGTFDMQFHLKVVSIFLKTCVKDHGDRSSQLLHPKISE